MEQPHIVSGDSQMPPAGAVEVDGVTYCLEANCIYVSIPEGRKLWISPLFESIDRELAKHGYPGGRDGMAIVKKALER
jgi:hypothetical protein